MNPECRWPTSITEFQRDVFDLNDELIAFFKTKYGRARSFISEISF